MATKKQHRCKIFQEIFQTSFSNNSNVLIKPTVFVMTKQKGWEIKPSGRGMKMCFLGQTPCCWCYKSDESESKNKSKIKASEGWMKMCFLGQKPCRWSYTSNESERANENKSDIKPLGGGRKMCFL